jgi:hypothetical protein
MPFKDPIKNREWARNHMRHRSRELLRRAKIELGGVCSQPECSETDFDQLQFHHIDRDQKCFDISTKAGRVKKSVFWAEVNKCRLLCKTCHHEVSVYGGDYSYNGGMEEEEFDDFWDTIAATT